MEKISEPLFKIMDVIPRDRLSRYLKSVSDVFGMQVRLLDPSGAVLASVSVEKEAVPPDPDLPWERSGEIQGDRPVESEGPEGSLLMSAPVSFKGANIAWLTVCGEGEAWRGGRGLPVLELSAKHLESLAEAGLDVESLSGEVVRVYEELALIYGLTSRLGAKVGVDEICHVVADEAEKVLRPTDLMVMLADEDAGLLRSVAALGSHKELSMAFTPGLEEGLIGRSFVGHKSVLVCDVSVDRRHKNWPYVIGRLMVSPLVVGDNTIGVICASDKRDGVEFDSREEKLISTVASVAAIAIKNAQLYSNITRLLDGFIDASVSAVEYRDPTTAGHSARVAVLTVELAKKIAASELPAFKNVSFSKEQLLEMRYAGLLHDFGKIGVRESVLLKGAKLEAHRIEIIRGRFAYIAERKKRESLEKKLKVFGEAPREEYNIAASVMDEALKEELSLLDKYLQLIELANDPHVLVTDLPELTLLGEVAKCSYTGPGGETEPFLLPFEFNDLHVLKGSLNESERREIESHVTHSYNFLTKIPWTRNFPHISDIVHAHHEKLDGSGYPKGLTSGEIPLQAKMMAVADIYDALTAWDRPYKKSVSTQKALFILDMEAQEGKLDPYLVQIFRDAKVYEAARGVGPMSRANKEA